MLNSTPDSLNNSKPLLWLMVRITADHLTVPCFSYWKCIAFDTTSSYRCASIIIFKLSLIFLTWLRDGACTQWEWTAADDSSAGSGPDAGPGTGRHATSDCYTNKRASWPGKMAVCPRKSFILINHHVSLLCQCLAYLPSYRSGKNLLSRILKKL